MSGSGLAVAIRLELADEVATLRLDRPDKANSMTMAMLRSLTSFCAELREDRKVKTVILTGSGARTFCGGADLAEITESLREPSAQTHYNHLWDLATEALASLPVPVVAVINGACVAAGLSLALCCDFRLSVPSAYLNYPRVAQGHLPGKANLRRLIPLIGTPRAKLIMLTGRRVTPEEAVRWGLVDEIVDPRQLGAEVERFISPFRALDADVLVASKRVIDHSLCESVWSDAESAVSSRDADALLRLRRQTWMRDKV